MSDFYKTVRKCPKKAKKCPKSLTKYQKIESLAAIYCVKNKGVYLPISVQFLKTQENLKGKL